MNLYFALIITGILLLILIWIHYRHTRGPERSAPDRGSASVPNQTLIANREGEELDSEELQRLGESINIHTSPENRGDSVGLEAQEEIALEPAPDEVMLQFNLELAEPHPVEQVCSLLAGRGLQPAPDGLYTKVLPDDPQQRSLYYLANGAREDGRLALEDDSEPVQYLVFFMQLPGPIAGGRPWETCFRSRRGSATHLAGCCVMGKERF